MDLIIAVVVFLLAIGIFYFFTNSKTTTDQSTLKIETQVVAERLTGDESTSILNGTVVDEEKLQNLTTTDYETLKASLGVRDDFCIVFRDQEGNIILVGENKTGIGNPSLNLTIDGTTFKCGEAYVG